MKPKPHSDLTPPVGPQHEIDVERGICSRCYAGLQQIQHGYPCVSDEAVELCAVVGRLRRQQARI